MTLSYGRDRVKRALLANFSQLLLLKYSAKISKKPLLYTKCGLFLIEN